MSGDDEQPRPRYEYKEYPKTLAPDDFWGQVRRTRYGKPIAEEDLQVIVDTISRGLDLQANDVLLDLACGNGALSYRLFDRCRAFIGVDASEYLIGVAKDNFERLPEYGFLVQDVGDYVWEATDPERFTKAMCYASFAYLSEEVAARMLGGLRERFANVELVLVGNVPDKDRAELFYGEGSAYTNQLSDPDSQIGIWWSEDELAEFAATHGWRMRVMRMPSDVFNAAYRYDAILTRRS